MKNNSKESNTENNSDKNKEKTDLSRMPTNLNNNNNNVNVDNSGSNNKFLDGLKNEMFKRLSAFVTLNDNDSYLRKTSSNESFIVFILTKQGIYSNYFKNYFKDYNRMVKHLKQKSNWTPLLLEQSKHQTIKFDINIDNELQPSSIILATDTLQIIISNISFKEDRQNFKNPKIYNLSSELKESAYNQDSLKHLNLIDVKQRNNLIFIVFNKKIVLFNSLKKIILQIWTFETESVVGSHLLDCLYDNCYYYFLITTNRNLKYTKVNYSLEEFEYNKLLGADFFTKGLKVNFNDKECVICKKPTKKMCSSCKEAYYCSSDHQILDWNNLHKYYCIGIPNNDDYIKDIVYIPNIWSLKRKIIILIYKSYKSTLNRKTIEIGIDFNSFLVTYNRNLLNLNIKGVKIMNGNIIKSQSSLNNFVNFSNLLIDYISNCYLLVQGYILKNDRNEALAILMNLQKELEDKYDFLNVIEEALNIIKVILNKEKIDNPDKLHFIFVDIMKTIITLGKMYYFLGEYKYFNEYLIHYVEKFEKYCQYTSNTFLIAKLYYFLGNLYIELDKLNYSIILFNESLNEMAKLNDEYKYVDLLICINFNLSLVYYVTDQFNLCIIKLERCLKLSEELKKDSCSETTCIIFETLGEVYLENKQFPLSLIYLKKALETRKLIMFNSVVNKQSHEKAITKILILIDYINSIMISEEDNAKTNDQQKKKIKTNETANKLGMNLAKMALNSLGNINSYKNDLNSKIFNNNHDLFDYVYNLNTGHGKQNDLEKIIQPKDLNKEKENIDKGFNDKIHNFFDFKSLNNEYELINKPKKGIKTFEDNSPYNHLIDIYSKSKIEKDRNIEQIKKNEIKDSVSKRKNLSDDDKEEIEKFFIFISKLTPKQIETLNLGQLHLNYNIPINFSTDFKNEISHIQKLELTNFKMILLTRANLLKNPIGRIEEDNLNYDLIYNTNNAKNKTNISSIKNFFITSKILKNWDVSNNSKTNNIKPNLSKELKIGRKSSITIVDNKLKPDVDFLKNIIRKNTDEANLAKKNYLEDSEKSFDGEGSENKPVETVESNFNKNKDNKINLKEIDFNFQQFKEIILTYIKKNVTSTDSVFQKVNDKVLYKISKDLTRNELIYLMKEPFVFFEFLDNQDIILSEESVKNEVSEEELEEKEENEENEIIEEVDESNESIQQKNIIDFDTMKKANI